MAEVLTQNEVNQLLKAIGPDREKTSKKRSGGKSIVLSQQENDELLEVLSQEEVDILLEKISGNYKNQTVIDKILCKLKNSTIAKAFKPPVKRAGDSELSEEEINMLLNQNFGKK